MLKQQIFLNNLNCYVCFVKSSISHRIKWTALESDDIHVLSRKK